MTIGILYCKALSSCGSEQHRVGADKDRCGEASGEVVVAPGERAGQLHRVVCTQGMRAAESSGAREDGTTHMHDEILAYEAHFEVSDQAVTAGGADAARRHPHHAGEGSGYLPQGGLG